MKRIIWTIILSCVLSAATISCNKVPEHDNKTSIDISSASENNNYGSTELSTIEKSSFDPQTTSSTTATVVASTEYETTTTSNFLIAFEHFSEYTEWAEKIGYSEGMLNAEGVSGINQDYFHTLPNMQEYSSGRIVVGDSRCCQLGMCMILRTALILFM